MNTKQINLFIEIDFQFLTQYNFNVDLNFVYQEDISRFWMPILIYSLKIIQLIISKAESPFLNKYNFKMSKNNNRGVMTHEESKVSMDYFNFIRRNQQIVQQFKVISKLEKKSIDLQKRYSDSNTNLYKKTYDSNNRLTESLTPKIYETKSSPHNKKQVLSLKLIEGAANNQCDSPIAKRKTKADGFLHKLIEKETFQVKSRNLSIPTYFSSHKDNNQFGKARDQLKFPKLSANRYSSYDQLSSESSLSLEKQIIAKKTKKIPSSNYEDQLDLKKNYAPLNIDNSRDKKYQTEKNRCKVKSMKFSDMPKAKLNGKLIKTYYDYENIMQLKDKVTELIPTFKPLQPRKRQKIQIVQIQQHRGQLQKYLETNRLQKPTQYEKVISKKQIDIFFSKQQQQQESERKINTKEKQQETQQTEKTLKKQRTVVKHSSSSPIKKKSKMQIIPKQNNNQQATVYQNKIISYRQFLFLVNFSHRVFDSLILKDDPESMKNERKYKFYLGKGNNSLLIKSLMKRRFWWTQVDDIREANFVWTQLKINNYYQFQRPGILENKFDKLDEDYLVIPPKQKKIIKKTDNTKKQEEKIKGGILRGQLPEKQNKIFTNADKFYYQQMLSKPQKPEKLRKFENRLKYLPEQFLKLRQEQDYQGNRMHNHFVNNYEIGNKKALFYHLKHYYDMIEEDAFKKIPLTFHIKNGINDPEYQNFVRQYKKIKSELIKAEKSNLSTKKLSKNVWIVKPGELSNRGNGITVIDELYQLNSILKSNNKHSNGQDKTFIVQKYIEKPMLYKSRKFDIRHYMMISRMHGRLRAYWFSEGYIRTSSFQYDLEEVGDVMIHLTNDAIQKNCASYGKYEEGNKLSYAQFQRYLDITYPQKKYSFLESIYPKMREIATDAIKATYLWMDPQALQHNFEIFGLDFMIDSQFNVWLIEVNSNPCLELSSVLLSRLIPTMLEHSLRLSLDPIFPPTTHFANTIKYLAPDSPLERLQYQLIFDEGRDGKAVEAMFEKAGKADCGQIEEQDETYENDGNQLDIGGDLE